MVLPNAPPRRSREPGLLNRRTEDSVLPVLALYTTAKASPWVIPVMVLSDGSYRRPFQMVVGVLVFVALLLLFRCHGGPQVGSNAPQVLP